MEHNIETIVTRLVKDSELQNFLEQVVYDYMDRDGHSPKWRLERVIDELVSDMTDALYNEAPTIVDYVLDCRKEPAFNNVDAGITPWVRW